MRKEFEMNGPKSPTASDLPVFADECHANHSEGLDDAVSIMNEYLAFETFDLWLDEKFTSTCKRIESDLDDMINVAAFSEAETVQNLMLNDWF